MGSEMPNWDHVLREILKEPNDEKESGADKVRQKYLMELHRHTGRNIICYYSGFLSKPRIEGIELNDDDKNGFMLCVHKLERTKGLDLFIHTPGGSGAATASLIDYLKRMFGNDIRAFVPQIAMSAGTILACACREIVMGKHSNLGPVDPQINGFPAHAVIEEIKTAYEESRRPLSSGRRSVRSALRRGLRLGSLLMRRLIIRRRFSVVTRDSRS
jgi:ClpP class serine protease